ncbi:hypothetical protein C8R45DRAFT_543972 [Mycena sanguinolenta]|nr:hypothetical protein C8R45DRAFT_543972 [Mycena sanguinolenta]
MFVLLTFSCLLVSSSCPVCAFPPSPMFVLLTFSCLLVSSQYVLFPHRPCLSCSLFLAVSSLARSACFSPIAHVCLAHFFSPSCLQAIVRSPISLIGTHFSWLQPYRSIWDQGLLQTWETLSRMSNNHD